MIRWSAAAVRPTSSAADREWKLWLPATDRRAITSPSGHDSIVAHNGQNNVIQAVSGAGFDTVIGDTGSGSSGMDKIAYITGDSIDAGVE